MNYQIVAVPTRILTHRDNICDAINKFGKGKFGPNDVICVAESVVAITQNRAVRCEDFKPTLLAKFLCRLFPSKGSLSGWYSMQSLLDAEGNAKVVSAVIVGGIAKIFGKPGVFYERAGEQARLIDDVTGTMPPYDKHIVYGPKNPDEVVKQIKERLHCHGAVIADVNDLKRSRIVGVTEGTDGAVVAHLLIDNPFGNASQKTPIVIIKNFTQYEG